MNEAQAYPPVGKTRPLGLYPLSLLDGLLLGVIPFVALVWGFLSGALDVPKGYFALLAVVTGGIVICSAGVFAGEEVCRIALQVLVVAYWTVVVISTMAVAEEDAGSVSSLGVVASLIKAAIWISGNVWYLNTKATIRYCAP
jgi:hypothetical protein